MLQQEFYMKILDSLADAVYFVDTERRITYWNKSAERLSGYPASVVIGKSCSNNMLLHIDEAGNNLCTLDCPLAATMGDGKVREADIYMHHRNGCRVPVSVRASPVRDDSGKIIGAVEVFSSNVKYIDVINELEGLRREALRDPLTGIGNRRYAEITMRHLEAGMVEYGVPYGVLFVDIDHFKNVNDTWGHDTGDMVLRMVAQTLAKALRPLDVACRWGGEEFVLIAPNVTGESLYAIAQRLRMLVASSWIELDDKQIAVTVSLGGAISCHGERPLSVVGRADKQVYRSKESGRNCVHLDLACCP